MAKLKGSVDNESKSEAFTSQTNPSTSSPAAYSKNESDKNSDKNISISSRVTGSSSDSDTDSDFDDVRLPPMGKAIVFSEKDKNENKEIVNGGSESNRPNIESIVVQNSSDITFGNKTFYQGPVTIKQFLLEKDRWKKSENGITNAGFHGSCNSSIDNPKDEIDGISTKPLDNWFYRLHPLKRNGLIGIIILIILILFSTVLLVIITLTAGKKNNLSGSQGENSNERVPINSNIDDDIIDENVPLRIISRLQWLAEPPKAGVENQILPVQRVIIAHTATESCKTQSSCIFQAKTIQEFHMESRRWSDIGYNYLIGGDGNAYEGRGFSKMGAHTLGFNNGSICIALIGTFNTISPTKRQMHACKLLIEEGVKQGAIRQNYTLYGHRQLAPFESPGDVVYEIIKKWPHWTDIIESGKPNPYIPS